MDGDTTEVLLLRLEGPLQAWGDNARWSVRGTRLEPTKSGVIGLIGAAMGLPLTVEGDRRLRELAAAVQLGVRVDRPGVQLRDYHTVGGTRSGGRTPWSGLLQADGKIKRIPGTAELHTEPSERMYLADACFLVGVAGPPPALDAIENALSDPVWPPFLGRKSCPPALPLLPVWPDHSSRVRGMLVAVLTAFPWLGSTAIPRPANLRLVVEAGAAGGFAGLRTVRQDAPASFVHRVFYHRDVVEGVIPTPEEVAPCI